MTTELFVLALAGLLQGLQFLLMAVAANIQLGSAKTAGTRDEPLEMTGVAGRLKRAMDNHFEALILFTMAVVVVTFADQATPVTGLCAYGYLAARILYVPAYVSGIPYLRSFIWMVGFGATITMFIAALM